MAFIFLAKCRFELGDQRLMGGIVVKLIARRQDELFECHGLALGVDSTRHAADTATAHGGIVGKQYRKTTQIGRQFVLTERNGRAQTRRHAPGAGRPWDRDRAIVVWWMQDRSS